MAGGHEHHAVGVRVDPAMTLVAPLERPTSVAHLGVGRHLETTIRERATCRPDGDRRVSMS
jgi:hypothetical protein